MAECRGFKNKLGTIIVSLIAKVKGATAGNIATFNSDGEVIDSGKGIDTKITSGSSNLITSGAVYEKTSDFNIKLVNSGGRIRLLFNESIDSSGPVVYPLRKFVVINYVTGVNSNSGTLTEETYLGLFNYEEDPSDSDAPITIYIQIGGACISFSGSFRSRADGRVVFIPANDIPQTYYNNYKIIGSGTQNSYPSKFMPDKEPSIPDKEL